MSIDSGSSSSAPSSSSSSRHGGTYYTHDVFLSFRGEDTRKNFVDRLYAALVQAGIRTFLDDDSLPRGEDISTQIVKAIEESKISLVIFSDTYASSFWCLDELVKILERRKMGQIAIPVFYDVDPSDVSDQRRRFGYFFAVQEDRFRGETKKVEMWREALREAANLSGWCLDDVANRDEKEFIRRIVSDLSVRLIPNYSQNPVGTLGEDRKMLSAKNLPSHPPPKDPIQPILSPPNNLTQSTLFPPKNPSLSHVAPTSAYKFYFEGFPDWIDFKGMKEVFARLGEVLEMSISKKKNKLGRRFGFVSLRSRIGLETLLVRLNDISLGTYKLCVNVARNNKWNESIIVSPAKERIAQQQRKVPHAPLKLCDDGSYAEVMSPMVQKDSKDENVKPAKEKLCSENPIPEQKRRSFSYVSKDEVIDWLKRSLVCVISEGVNYGTLKDDLVAFDLGFEDFRFLGASQAVITFVSVSNMHQALEDCDAILSLFFDEARPWIVSDGAYDRFCWLEIHGLPLIAWTMNCIANLLTPYGRVIGFDKLSLGFSTLSSVRILIGTGLRDGLDEQVHLKADGVDFNIQIKELTSVSSLDFSSVEFSKDKFTVQQREDRELEAVSAEEEHEVGGR